MEQSDETLILAFRKGEQAAFELLLQRHAGPLLGYLCRMLGDQSEAEDLFQETFRRMLTKLETFDETKRFKPWLYAIAQNLTIDTVRARQRRPEHTALDDHMDQVADTGLTPSEEMEKADRKRQVRTVVAELPPRQRSTLILAYFHGMSYPEVAAAMECSVGTVKTQMSRALKVLALKLPEPTLVPKP